MCACVRYIMSVLSWSEHSFSSPCKVHYPFFLSFIHSFIYPYSQATLPTIKYVVLCCAVLCCAVQCRAPFLPSKLQFSQFLKPQISNFKISNLDSSLGVVPYFYFIPNLGAQHTLSHIRPQHSPTIRGEGSRHILPFFLSTS